MTKSEQVAAAITEGDAEQVNELLSQQPLPTVAQVVSDMVPKDRCADAEVEAHIACFGMLIEAGADPFLESATAEGDTDTAFSIALLKGAGSSLYSVACDIAKRDVSGDLAFLQMVHRGEVGGVRAELKKSTCARRTHLLNKTDGNCSTIILAVLSGEQAMLKLLLSEEYGIITKDTVNFCGVAGATALIEACKFVDLECVQYLCSHPHNDVNVGDDSNVTALMEAVNTAADNVGNQGELNRCVKIARLLLEKGANKDQQETKECKGKKSKDAKFHSPCTWAEELEKDSRTKKAGVAMLECMRKADESDEYKDSLQSSREKAASANSGGVGAGGTPKSAAHVCEGFATIKHASGEDCFTGCKKCPVKAFINNRLCCVCNKPATGVTVGRPPTPSP
eukprot:gene15097-31093_t